jgi:DNA gyrase/topoisomerase IV subunit A
VLIEETISKWLETLELNLEQRVIAGLALQLAKSFDQNPHTSTAAELRKTVLELQRQLSSSKQDYDPISELLTR